VVKFWKTFYLLSSSAFAAAGIWLMMQTGSVDGSAARAFLIFLATFYLLVGFIGYREYRRWSKY